MVDHGNEYAVAAKFKLIVVLPSSGGIILHGP